MLKTVRVSNPTANAITLIGEMYTYSVPAYGSAILGVRDYRDLVSIPSQAIVEAPMVMADTLNIVRFGAIGDGKTDDADAIQRALDSAYSLGGGDVFVPSGKYVCERELFVRDNVGITGEGESSYIYAKYGMVISGDNSYIRDVVIRRN